MSLRLVPVSWNQAKEHIAAWHRHLDEPRGLKWCVGVADDENVLRAVAVIGRPTAAGFDDGMTLEVTRVASDGYPNANSMLYGAAARGTFAMGYRRLVTYTERDEGGASLRAAGWKVIAERPARKGWDAPSRPRDNTRYRSVARQLWEREPA